MLKRIISVVGILVFIFITYNLVGQILNTLKSGDRLTETETKLKELQSQNSQLKNRLAEVQTPDFVEQQARDSLGLAKDGETLVIIPEEKINLILEASKEAQIVRLPNLLGWWKVFF